MLWIEWTRNIVYSHTDTEFNLIPKRLFFGGIGQLFLSYVTPSPSPGAERFGRAPSSGASPVIGDSVTDSRFSRFSGPGLLPGPQSKP